MKRLGRKAMCMVNIAMIAAILVLNYLYQRNGFLFSLKYVCSAGFTLLATINLCHALVSKQGNKRFHIAMSIGLFLAFLGDVFIDANFILGAAAFAVGHICFLIAYCFLQKWRASDLIPSGILFLGALLFLLFCPLLSFDVPMLQVVCIAYALIISCMLGKAIGNLVKEHNVLTITIAIASALFFISDLMLVFSWFIGLWNWTNHACMGAYYPALCLLAFAMHVAIGREKGEGICPKNPPTP